MYRIMAIFLVVFLCGCRTTDDESDYYYIEDRSDSRSNVPLIRQDDSAPVREYDIAYEVENTHFGSTENPIDVFSVEIFRNQTNLVNLAKYVSKRDAFYYLSATYAGDKGPFMS